jgi:hypothetical protein
VELRDERNRARGSVFIENNCKKILLKVYIGEMAEWLKALPC